LAEIQKEKWLLQHGCYTSPKRLHLCGDESAEKAIALFPVDFFLTFEANGNKFFTQKKE